jgi:uncharacterized protein YecE (DUF72 family)
MTSGNLVLVGASGWQHPAWRGAFYPADLPDDWQLSYYSTQFQARVVLATPAWEAAHLWWLDAAPDLRQLAQRITRHAETGAPLYVFSRSGDLGLLEQALSLKQVMGY